MLSSGQSCMDRRRCSPEVVSQNITQSSVCTNDILVVDLHISIQQIPQAHYVNRRRTLHGCAIEAYKPSYMLVALLQSVAYGRIHRTRCNAGETSRDSMQARVDDPLTTA
jgi:hypothetical protein